MKLKELSTFLQSAVETGALNALAGIASPARITKAEAYRLYGRSDVDRWIAEGLIVPVMLNGRVSKRCIEREQLDGIARSSNRSTYLPVAERKG